MGLGTGNPSTADASLRMVTGGSTWIANTKTDGWPTRVQDEVSLCSNPNTTLHMGGIGVLGKLLLLLLFLSVRDSPNRKCAADEKLVVLESSKPMVKGPM